MANDNVSATLEEQRKAVMARYEELVNQRTAINREIDEVFTFFAGKEVRVKHSRGSFDAIVRRVYHDGEMSVTNINTGNTSTRSLHELAAMLEEDTGE